MLLTRHILLLYLSSRTVFSYFCRLRLDSDNVSNNKIDVVEQNNECWQILSSCNVVHWLPRTDWHRVHLCYSWTNWSFLMFPGTFRNQKPTFLLFGGDGTFWFFKRRMATTKVGNHLIFWRSFTTNHNQPHPNLFWKRQQSFLLWRYGRSLSTPLWLKQLIKIWFPFSIDTLSVYSEKAGYSGLQRRFRVVSRLWTQFSYSVCERSCQRNENEFP